MITRRLLLGSALAIGFAFPAYAETLNILMEGVPDTEFVKEVVPEFEAATGHKVKLVPQPLPRAAGARLMLTSHASLARSNRTIPSFRSASSAITMTRSSLRTAMANQDMCDA